MWPASTLGYKAQDSVALISVSYLGIETYRFLDFLLRTLRGFEENELGSLSQTARTTQNWVSPNQQQQGHPGSGFRVRAASGKAGSRAAVGIQSFLQCHALVGGCYSQAGSPGLRVVQSCSEWFRVSFSKGVRG